MSSVPRFTIDGHMWSFPDTRKSSNPLITEPIPIPIVVEEPERPPELVLKTRESFFVFSDDPVEVARSERRAARNIFRKRRWFPAIEDTTPMHDLTQEELGVRAWSREWIMRKQTMSTMPRYVGPSFDIRTVTIALIVDLWRTQKGICALSGRQMVIPQLRNVGKGKRPPRESAHVASVDRIDSNVGYQAGNIQLACYMPNCMKTNMGESEFIEWCQDVAKTRG